MSIRVIMAAGVCVAAALAVSAGAAQAQTIYFGVHGGWTHLGDEDSRAAGFPTARSKFDDGFAVGGKVGYEMGPWRFEEEYTYRANDLSGITFGGFPIAGANGNRQSHAVMTNLYYSFTLPWSLALTPYVGAGVGAVDVIDHASAPAPFGRFFNDSAWEFGYQAMGGLRYNFNPSLALDVEYRYFATTDPTFRVRGRNATYKTSYETQNVLASLVYRWLPPAPPPPVAVPPAPPPPPPAPAPVFRGERG
jgi:opacity protein-like surface antigen